MYGAGLVEETRRLVAAYGRGLRPLRSIGYAEAVAILEGTMSVTEGIAETRRRTRAYAKRQMTWLRAERDVHWLEATRIGLDDRLEVAWIPRTLESLADDAVTIARRLTPAQANE
jgi:tRNA A37 N6-isopentenylltransferase MiaA